MLAKNFFVLFDNPNGFRLTTLKLMLLFCMYFLLEQSVSSWQSSCLHLLPREQNHVLNSAARGQGIGSS